MLWPPMKVYFLLRDAMLAQYMPIRASTSLITFGLELKIFLYK